ncbi:MAG: hypothetical protein V4773_16175 [Verrucomicrobiota bacterium]
MLLDTATSLADFLNHNSPRFLATVLDFGNKGWVIVGEKLPDGSRRLFRETISDPADYVRRARAGITGIDTEYDALIEEWLRRQA